MSQCSQAALSCQATAREDNLFNMVGVKVGLLQWHEAELMIMGCAGDSLLCCLGRAHTVLVCITSVVRLCIA